MNQISIEIPSSSANVGLGYDIWCLGLERPRLNVVYTRSSDGIELEARTASEPPAGMTLGLAGKVALKNFLRRLRCSKKQTR